MLNLSTRGGNDDAFQLAGYSLGKHHRNIDDVTLRRKTQRLRA